VLSREEPGKIPEKKKRRQRKSSVPAERETTGLGERGKLEGNSIFLENLDTPYEKKKAPSKGVSKRTQIDYRERNILQGG